jgi:hypothetical protein
LADPYRAGYVTPEHAQKRMKQLEAALGRRSLENEILKEAVDFTHGKYLDCELASKWLLTPEEQ